MSFRKPCNMPFRKLIAPFTLTVYVCMFVSMYITAFASISSTALEIEALMRSFAQEKKSQQAPEIDALVRDRKVFAWCHKIN